MQSKELRSRSLQCGPLIFGIAASGVYLLTWNEERLLWFADALHVYPYARVIVKRAGSGYLEQSLPLEASLWADRSQTICLC